METVDYTTRQDLVDAVVEFQRKGIEVDVVGNGLTLQFPNGIGATPEEIADAEQEESLVGVVQPEEQPPATEDDTPASTEVEQPSQIEEVVDEAEVEQPQTVSSEEDIIVVEGQQEGTLESDGPLSKQQAGTSTEDEDDLIGTPVASTPTVPSTTRKRGRKA